MYMKFWLLRILRTSVFTPTKLYSFPFYLHLCPRGIFILQEWQHSKECMCRLQNIAMCDQEKCDYQESMTTRETDQHTPDKVLRRRHKSDFASNKF